MARDGAQVANRNSEMARIKSYAQGEWIEGAGKATDSIHAVTGEKIGEATSEGLDFKGMLDYARNGRQSEDARA